MPTVTSELALDDDGLAALRQPRTDIVAEAADGPDRWRAETGPFRTYERTIDVRLGSDLDRPHRVTETTRYRLAIPLWAPLFAPLMRRAVRGPGPAGSVDAPAQTPPDRSPRRRWWWPEEVVARQTTELVSAVCLLSIVGGYLGVVIGQTITFAAREFGQADSAQANTLAATRIGVLLSFVLLLRADKIGRRPLMLWFATGAVLFTLLGALSPNLFALGATQTIARGLTTGLFTVMVLAATEEVPSSARAFSVSLATVAAALGAGMVLWVLPTADLFTGGWRIVYVAPALFLPVIWWVSRYLPETRRFVAATTEGAPARINRRWLTLIGLAAFGSLVFLTPASQLRNEFLADDLGYSATRISAFQLIVSTPAGVAVVAAGIVADRLGRRWVGAIALALGTATTVASYQLTGAGLWVFASLGVILTSAAFPAMRAYQTELFPTRARARVGAIMDVIGVLGSVTGLVLVGLIADRWTDLGTAIGAMMAAPLLVAVLILVFFPETANQELEAFNPSDPSPANQAPTQPTISSS
ncbi:MAG: MFS transporter [Actinomycetota bacterium]